MFTALFHWLVDFTSSTSSLAFPWAIATAVVLAIASLCWSRSIVNATCTAIGGGLGAFYLLKLFIYFSKPVYNGFLGGRLWILIICLVASAIAGGLSAASGDNDDVAGFWAFSHVVLVVLLCLSMFIYTISTAWGTDHKRALVGLAHVTVAAKSETLPPTDPNHIVMVSQAMAAYRGHQVIGSNGGNLGSVWKTDISDYTLQSVQGRLYWIAPLQIQSGFAKFMGNAPDSPGYIRVDAEDPNGIADVKTDFHIRLMPGSSYQRQLERHLYMEGYRDVHLDDPTIEVDDNWQPYYTVTAWKYAWATQGRVVVKVLLVNAQTETITSYAPNMVPSWVDRIISKSIVQQFASDWGAWSDTRSSWPNQSGAYQQKPDGIELVYNNADKPIWLVPMTSNNNSDTSANGVMVYSTQEAKATYYPGLSGIGVGGIVTQAFQKITANTNNKLDVQSVQLYQIEGRPTWVAIYGYAQDNGTESFGGIGFVDAHELNSANVQFANNKQDALQLYKSWIAGGGGNSANVAKEGKPSKPVTGQVKRVGWTMVGGTATYYVTIVGDSHVFTVTSKEFDSLPLVHEGDSVTITYVDSNETSVPARSFSDADAR